jgi:sugar phosphate isomerase/epimerase
LPRHRVSVDFHSRPRIRFGDIESSQATNDLRNATVDSPENRFVQAPIMLTLETGSLAARLAGGKNALERSDLPRYAIEELGLRGLSIASSILAGCGPRDLDRLRDAADRAHCPCLSMVESTPLGVDETSGCFSEAAADRLQRLAAAASRLGCSALAISVASDAKSDPDQIAGAVRQGVQSIERHELNLLVTPSSRGLLASSEGVIDLIRRVGGFRIGCMPTFGHAVATDDGEATLRRLAPYASAMVADLDPLTASKGGVFDQRLSGWVRAIRTVGFASTLALSSTARDAATRIVRARELLEPVIVANAPEDQDA